MNTQQPRTCAQCQQPLPANPRWRNPVCPACIASSQWNFGGRVKARPSPEPTVTDTDRDEMLTLARCLDVLERLPAARRGDVVRVLAARYKARA